MIQAKNPILCWALKTRDLTEPQRPCDYWNRFLSEDVIAIGWPAIDVRPDEVSPKELANNIINTHRNEHGESAYSRQLAKRIAYKIQSFAYISIGDKILICQGYAPNQKPETQVRLYGVARVDHPFYVDQNSNWWKFKHKATILSFGEDGLNVEKGLLVRTLGKGSLMEALHQIDCEKFERLLEYLHRTFGVNFNL